MRAVQGTFYVSGNGVQPLEDLAVIFGTAGGEDWLMLESGLRYPGETLQTIGDDQTSGADVRCGTGGDFVMSEAAEMCFASMHNLNRNSSQ